jgi:hypothetical protein
MQAQSTTLAPTTPDGPRARALLHAGYLPDVAPDHIRPETLAIDRRIVKGMKCQQCRKRQMRLRPFARGNNYEALAVCQHCGHEERV